MNNGLVQKNIHVGSVFQNEQELLSSLIDLYCPIGIELDPMYHQGKFYKNSVKRPDLIFDIDPIVPECKYADARKLSLEKNSIKSEILDPPFVFGIHGTSQNQKNNQMAKKFGIFPTFRELSLLYQELLYESFRVLEKKGVLIFKSQDYTDSKTTLTHCHIHQWALEVGFKIEDIAILHCTINKIWNPNLTQRHLRKHHCYFMVFRK